MIFELLNDTLDTINSMPFAFDKRRLLVLLSRAITNELQFIHRHPTFLFQSVWNGLRWYDGEHVERFFVNLEGRFSPDDEPEEPIGFNFVERWKTQKSAAIPGIIWIERVTPPHVHLSLPVRLHILPKAGWEQIERLTFSYTSCYAALTVNRYSEVKPVFYDVESGREVSVQKGVDEELDCLLDEVSKGESHSGGLVGGRWTTNEEQVPWNLQSPLLDVLPPGPLATIRGESHPQLNLVANKVTERLILVWAPGHDATLPNAICKCEADEGFEISDFLWHPSLPILVAFAGDQVFFWNVLENQSGYVAQCFVISLPASDCVFEIRATLGSAKHQEDALHPSTTISTERSKQAWKHMSSNKLRWSLLPRFPSILDNVHSPVLVCSNAAGQISLVSVPCTGSPTIRRTIQLELRHGLLNLLVTSDARKLAVLHGDGAAFIDLDQGKVYFEQINCRMTILSPDGRYFGWQLFGGDIFVCEWTNFISQPRTRKREGHVKQIVISKDSNCVVDIRQETPKNIVRYWGPMRSNVVSSNEMPSDLAIYNLSYDSKVIVGKLSSFKNKIGVWNASGEPVLIYNRHSEDVNGVSTHHSKSWVVSWTDHEIRLWDWTTGVDIAAPITWAAKIRQTLFSEAIEGGIYVIQEEQSIFKQTVWMCDVSSGERFIVSKGDNVSDSDDGYLAVRRSFEMLPTTVSRLRSEDRGAMVDGVCDVSVLAHSARQPLLLRSIYGHAIVETSRTAIPVAYWPEEFREVHQSVDSKFAACVDRSGGFVIVRFVVPGHRLTEFQHASDKVASRA